MVRIRGRHSRTKPQRPNPPTQPIHLFATQDGVTLNPDRKSKLGGTGSRPRGGGNGGGGNGGFPPLGGPGMALPGAPGFGMLGAKQEFSFGGASAFTSQQPVASLGPTQQHVSSRFRGVVRQGARWKAVIHIKGTDYFLG